MDIQRADAHRAIVGSYRDAAEEAAGNNKIISREEQKTLSPWAQDVMEEIRRTDGGRVNVERYVRAQAGGVSRELRRVAGADDQISRAEAETAHPEIRARLRTMFPSTPATDPTPTREERLNAVTDKLSVLEPVFAQMDDFDTPTTVDIADVGVRGSPLEAIHALGSRTPAAAFAPIPLHGDDAIGAFFRAFDDRTSHAFEPGVASEEQRAALPAFKDAVRNLFAGLDVTAYTAETSSPYWWTTENVLVGRDADNRYVALVHTSASES